MPQSTHVPPVTRWERLKQSATRIGVPPTLLMGELRAGESGIRWTQMGAQRLVMLAANDVDAFKAKLEQGAHP